MQREILYAAIAATIVTVASADARADMYTYTDSEGIVHYSNVPPGRSRGVRRVRTSTIAQPTVALGEPSVDRVRNYDPFIREAAALYRLPESFLRAIMKVESNG